MIWNKKGDLPDIIFYSVVLTIFAVAMLIGFKITSAMNDHFQTLEGVNITEVKEASATLTSFYPGVIDKSYLLFVMGIALCTLIAASMVPVSPIYIPFYLLGLFVTIFVSGVLSNLYQTMAANPAFSAESAQLVFIGMVMNKLPYFVGVVGIVLMVIMYKVYSTKNA